MSQAVGHHEALIYLMVLVSASDARMTDKELRAIGDVVRTFPVFQDFDEERLVTIAQDAGLIMSGPEGMQDLIALARSGIPERLVETAFACAVEVASADDRIVAEEMRVLELIRAGLQVERLSAAAIVRAARARHTKA